VTIKLEKVRNKVAGCIGEAVLLYNRSNGRYDNSAIVNAAKAAEGGGFKGRGG
jgi:hypothetical protein